MKAGCLPAVDGDGSVLTKLLFGLVHLSNEVDETFAHLGNSLFRPVGELKLTDCPGLTVLHTPAVILSYINQSIKQSINKQPLLQSDQWFICKNLVNE